MEKHEMDDQIITNSTSLTPTSLGLLRLLILPEDQHIHARAPKAGIGFNINILVRNMCA